MMINPILCYHGVTNSSSVGIENYSGKHIPISEFESQMKFIKEKMEPVSLREMVNSLQNNKPIQDAIAITFDDSYRNVFENAVPILAKYEIPATFFITTGFLDTDKLYWTDLLENIINKTTKNELKNELFQEISCSSFIIENKKQKINALLDTKTKMKELNPADRDTIIKLIIKELGDPIDYNFIANYKNLKSSQIKEIDQHDLFDIGGHSVNHEILSWLDDKNLYYEVNQCLDDLKKIVNHPIDLFSYPEGQHDHFNDTVIDVLQTAGVNICPTAINGFNPPGTDSFHLNRIMVGFMDTPFIF